MSLPQAVQPEASLPTLLSSTSCCEVGRELDPALTLPQSPVFGATDSPVKKTRKKAARQRRGNLEEVKQSSAEAGLAPPPLPHLSLYEGLEAGSAGIPQVSSNLTTLSDSDEGDIPVPMLLEKDAQMWADARLGYDSSFIRSLRNDPQSLLIPAHLVPIVRRSIRQIGTNCWLGEKPLSPVLLPAPAPADIPSWRRGETQEEHKINQLAKVQTARLKADKSVLEIQQRKIKGTLNKLSLDNFEKLKGQLLDLAKESEDTMELMVQMVFDKAVLQGKYTKLYAELCHYFDGFYASLCSSLAESRRNVRKQVEISRVSAESMPRSLRHESDSHSNSHPFRRRHRGVPNAPKTEAAGQCAVHRRAVQAGDCEYQHHSERQQRADRQQTAAWAGGSSGFGTGRKSLGGSEYTAGDSARAVPGRGEGEGGGGVDLCDAGQSGEGEDGCVDEGQVQTDGEDYIELAGRAEETGEPGESGRAGLNRAKLADPKGSISATSSPIHREKTLSGPASLPFLNTSLHQYYYYQRTECSCPALAQVLLLRSVVRQSEHIHLRQVLLTHQSGPQRVVVSGNAVHEVVPA